MSRLTIRPTATKPGIEQISEKSMSPIATILDLEYVINAGADIEWVGTTAKRPPIKSASNTAYFDTTLGKPIWFDGTNWIDATGTTV